MKIDTSNSDLQPSQAQSSRTNRIQVSDSPQTDQHYGIIKFPRELKRRFLEALEPRFYIILLTSIFLHASVIIYLTKHPLTHDKSAITEKVRKRFANLLLEGKEDLGAALMRQKPDESFADYPLLESRAKPSENESFDELLDLSNVVTLETRVPTAESRRTDRASRASERQRFLQRLTESVERIGLMGVLTTSTGNMQFEEVADILYFADSAKTDLEESLAFLQSLKVPRGIYPAYASLSPDWADFAPQFDALAEPAKVKGSRVTPAVEVNKIVAKLGDVEPVAVRKVREYEHVPSSHEEDRDRLGSLSSGASNGHAMRLRRDAKRVREVVLSHYTAIQDCYSQELKFDAGLKGKVVVRFVIAPAGNVIDARIIDSTIENEDMLDCIVSRVLRWTDFSPIHPSAGNMAIKQTYVFGF